MDAATLGVRLSAGYLLSTDISVISLQLNANNKFCYLYPDTYDITPTIISVHRSFPFMVLLRYHLGTFLISVPQTRHVALPHRDPTANLRDEGLR
jgi:hypothetical protein